MQRRSSADGVPVPSVHAVADYRRWQFGPTCGSLLALAPGNGVAAFCDVVESGQRRREVSDGGKLAVRVADTQNSQHRPAADDHPVHISPGALDADVIERREALASEEVNLGEIEDQLLGDASVMVHEAAKCMAVGGVDITSDADEHAPIGQLL